ncbi:MAG: PEP-CTERM sorting domain-containing protein [Planctomycetota bacterium]|nr:PEP-CTERM sorting domain-containing protein [Planctomycetota bacterium]
MRNILFASVAALICWAVCLGTAAEADIAVLVEATSLNDLVGDNPVHVGSLTLTTNMDSDSLIADVHSAAYTGDNGNFAYLYQIVNNGAAGDTAAEMFTLWPFSDAGANTQVGWLSAAVPSFLAGGVDSDDRAFIDGIPDEPVVSFYFTKLYSEPIGIGQHSKILYVLSQDSPSLITGNIIGGTVGSGLVIGPAVIPEPGTFACLVIGGLTALFTFRRRR